ncbi:hypothetical protein KXD40_009231 [Peronospora effusa]|nr:hypothetical protein KXD40_009231 [Peronospora effusa]
MRMRTFLVLVLVTVCSSCVNFANAKTESGIIAADLTAKLKNTFGARFAEVKEENSVLTKVAQVHEKMDNAASTHVVELKRPDELVQQMIEMDAKGTWSKEHAEAQLHQYLKNIDAVGWMKETPDGLRLRRIAVKAAEVVAAKPSTWSTFNVIVLIQAAVQLRGESVKQRSDDECGRFGGCGRSVAAHRCLSMEFFILCLSSGTPSRTKLFLIELKAKDKVL